MQWTIANCDILDRPADVLVLSGNPQLNLSGGAGGAFLLRYGNEMQERLHDYFKTNDKKFVDRGSVIQMPPCGSPYDAVLHAIGVDAFYDSNTDVIEQAITKSLELAAQLSAKTVALTAIATGYGRVSMHDFGNAIHPLISLNFHPIENVVICMQKSDAVKELAHLIPDAKVA